MFWGDDNFSRCVLSRSTNSNAAYETGLLDKKTDFIKGLSVNVASLCTRESSKMAEFSIEIRFHETYLEFVQDLEFVANVIA